MKSMHWRFCAFAVLLPLSVIAPAAPAAPADPSNAAAEVPAARYYSAFKNYQPTIDVATRPDEGWRAANDAVAAKPGDAHMMGMQTGGAMPAPIDKDMTMPVPGPRAGKAMPGMDMHHDHHDKGH